MRTLLCDADIPRGVVAALQQLSLPVISVTNIPHTSQDDFLVLEAAQKLDAILVTMDRDFTSNQPLFAAMVERGSRVVRLRLPKCDPSAVVETVAMLILANYRHWQDQLDSEPGLVSCGPSGSRLRHLSDFPWYRQAGKR